MPKPLRLRLDVHHPFAEFKFRQPNPELDQYQKAKRTNDIHTRERLLDLHKAKLSIEGFAKIHAIQTAGFKLDLFESNFGFLNPNRPIVYEVETLDVSRVRNFLMQQAMPARKRRQALKLLGEYLKLKHRFIPD